jgi:hypothetical protein
MDNAHNKHLRESSVKRQTAAEDAFADSQLGIIEPDRLFNEANLLRLEGRLFCFDPKEAGRRESGTYTGLTKW